MQYALPRAGAAKDEHGFYEIFQLNLKIVATTPQGDLKSITGTQQIGIRDVQTAEDAVYTNSKTLTKTLVLWSNPPGSNVLAAGGDDTVRSGGGADTLDGGTGTNQLSYELSNAGVAVDMSARTASGGFARGDSFTNFQNIAGSSYADTLSGDSGNNVLIGGAGADTLIGGAGRDVVDYSRSTAGVVVNLADQTASGGYAVGDQVSGFEGVSGSQYSDTLTGSSAANTLIGGDGDDLLIGGDGDDTLLGGSGGDTLRGGAGADSLAGGAGIDAVDYLGSSVGVKVNLLTGIASGGDAEGDRVSDLEIVIGSNNADTLIGGSGVANLFGHDGDDILVAGSANGTFDGGAGRDSLSYAALSKGISVDLTTGRASSTALAGNDTIIGIEDVIGTSFADLLIGDAGDNCAHGRRRRGHAGRRSRKRTSGCPKFLLHCTPKPDREYLRGAASDLLHPQEPWPLRSHGAGLPRRLTAIQKSRRFSWERVIGTLCPLRSRRDWITLRRKPRMSDLRMCRGFSSEAAVRAGP